MAYSRRDLAKPADSAAAGVASSVVVGTNTNRITLTISNTDATNTVYLAFQSALPVNGAPIAKGDTTTAQRPVAVVGKGVYLPPGQTFSTNDFSGAVAAIAAAGTPNLAIQEF